MISGVYCLIYQHKIEYIMSTFSDIYGYDTIKEHLQNAIKLDKVSHAYIINGGLVLERR